jgi:hypothetical protein
MLNIHGRGPVTLEHESWGRFAEVGGGVLSCAPIAITGEEPIRCSLKLRRRK